MLKIIVAAVVCLLLGGCALFGGGPQPGLTHFDLTSKAGDSVTWESGKEYEGFEACVVRPDGMFGYVNATGVKAFAGQEILKAMQQQQLDFLAALPGIIAQAAGKALVMAPRAAPEPAPTPAPSTPCAIAASRLPAPKERRARR